MHVPGDGEGLGTDVGVWVSGLTGPEGSQGVARNVARATGLSVRVDVNQGQSRATSG